MPTPTKPSSPPSATRRSSEPPREKVDLGRVFGEVAALHREGHLRFRSDEEKPAGPPLRPRIQYARGRLQYAAAGSRHAPKGGVSIGGTDYPGGEFIPGDVVAKATPAEKAKLGGKSGASRLRKALAAGGKAGKSPGDSGDFLPGFAPDGKPAKAKEKIRATAGAMSPARREGKAILLGDGTPAPAHIRPAMVPPNWTDVKVSTDPHADVLVRARDQAGRLKTVYSDSFTMRTAAAKFSRVREMMAKASEIHDQNQANRQSADPATRDAADLTWLIQEQATRPGSDSDTKAKAKAYGATTLRAEHVVEAADGVRLQFVGKEGVWHDHLVRDPGLAAMLLERKRTAEDRGGRLFSTPADKLNKYIATLDGGMFTAKDFRTLRANRLAVAAIREAGACCSTKKQYSAKVKEVAVRVSSVLGNRPSQALMSYIDPTVFGVWSFPGA